MKYLKLFFFLAFISSSCSKSNTQSPSSNIPPVINNKITYDQNIKPIMSRSCTGCHSGASASAGLLLETYIQVKNSTQNGNLIDRINDISNPMPQSGLMPLADREIIQIWADSNYIEN